MRIYILSNIIILIFSGCFFTNKIDDFFNKKKVSSEDVTRDIKFLLETIKLDVYDKKILKTVYKNNKYKILWDSNQRKNFIEILNKDKFLSLCKDKKYFDIFKDSQNNYEQDIILSLLFYKYSWNLENSCLNLNTVNYLKFDFEQNNIDIYQTFSLLSFGAIPEKILLKYIPKYDNFIKLIDFYQKNYRNNKLFKKVRLNIERYKIYKNMRHKHQIYINIPNKILSLVNKKDIEILKYKLLKLPISLKVSSSYLNHIVPINFNYLDIISIGNNKFNISNYENKNNIYIKNINPLLSFILNNYSSNSTFNKNRKVATVLNNPLFVNTTYVTTIITNNTIKQINDPYNFDTTQKLNFY